ncbi:MAG: magnesium transporter [Sulfuricaulis sp.]|uniref:magnesium transporter n=1 Tax=Sulfuricaulis sp. TaxID=2003553 RepID=UPI0034A564A6
MPAEALAAIDALNRRFLTDYPREAARHLEALPTTKAAEVLAQQPVYVIVPVWQHLSQDTEERLLAAVSDKLRSALFSELDPASSATLLNRIDPEIRAQYMAPLHPEIAKELDELMHYPPDSAGQLMDPRVIAFRADMGAREALTRLRRSKARALREIYVTDEEGRLSGRVEMQDLALADPNQRLADISRRIASAVQNLTPREEVVEILEQYKLPVLPVIDVNGRLVGVIHQAGLLTALQEETSLDIQTMVGASKDERALSKVPFAVIKRLPWLQINLLTAFLAASVVGLFESTIAKFTALAVLMPVVAGQSGNAGAQALAVTMRGLALREIGARHWMRVVWKEVNVGLLNGLAIALTTGVAVFFWSQSFGLSLVIGISMVLSMTAAGFSGAIIPIALTRMGQDPAQSSSIVLTTVTDVVGFLSFLGIATLLAQML